MKSRKSYAAFTSLVLFGVISAFAAPVVTVTSAVQESETNSVKVVYTLSEPAIVTFDVRTNNVSIAEGQVWSVLGDINRKLSAGTHEFIWFPHTGWPANVSVGDCRIALVPWALDNPPDYMVVKLGLSSNVTFHASAEAVPFGVASEASRRHQMVFRRIRAAGVHWRMGVDGNITGREIPHYVTLTNDYYMGVYPVTCEQHNMFLTPYSNAALVGPKPDNQQSYETLRGVTSGHNWPTDGHAVASDSVIGTLRIHAGLDGLDLPTEAEWEFACRAGNSGSWCFGNDVSLLPLYAWYNYRYGRNAGMPPVGLLQPNAFGLYDMHGTGFEWCLDWYSEGAAYCTAGAEVTAPTGPNTGSGRVIRGGSYAHDENYASSACRYQNGQSPGSPYTTIIYRLCCPANMRTAEDGAGTGGTPVAAVASVTDFAPAAKSETAADGLGTAQDPLDFVSQLFFIKDGLNFNSYPFRGIRIRIR